MNKKEEWLDVTQTMQFLNVSMSTLYRRINMDKHPLPPGTRMGGQRVYWNVNDLISWQQQILSRGNKHEE